MRSLTHHPTPPASILAAALLAGCGGGSSTRSTSSGAGPVRAVAAPLSAESTSAATGDIPDNQVFLSFRNRGAGYAIQYPEGWAQRGGTDDVTFQDKNNIVRVVVSRGAPPTPAAATAQLTRSSQRSVTVTKPAISVSIHAAPVLVMSYSAMSAPNPVTGKPVELLVDRYVFSRGGRVATVDLGTPRGVDNVDAYRMMSRSFRWL